MQITILAYLLIDRLLWSTRQVCLFDHRWRYHSLVYLQLHILMVILITYLICKLLSYIYFKQFV